MVSPFEDRLLDYLVQEHGKSLADDGSPQSRSATSLNKTRLALGGAAAGIALALACVLVISGGLGGGDTPAAFAIEGNPDGTVVLTLKEIIGVGGANAQLANLGVKAAIEPIEAGCTAAGVVDRTYGALAIVQDMVHPASVGGVASGEKRWLIFPSAIPPGDTLGLIAQRSEQGPAATAAYSFRLYRGLAPSCSPPGTFYRG